MFAESSKSCILIVKNSREMRALYRIDLNKACGEDGPDAHQDMVRKPEFIDSERTSKG